MSNFDIKFRKMSNAEFDIYVENSILDYSKDLIKSDFCSKETAFENSKKQFNELLPQGNQTKNNFICKVVNSANEDVGIIWFNKYNETMAFICDFLIFKEFRKKGYGRQTLLLLENEVKPKGFNRILLHVFNFNKIAFSLYTSLEYKIAKKDNSGTYMIKTIAN